jgi:hypothetical protein
MLPSEAGEGNSEYRTLITYGRVGTDLCAAETSAGFKVPAVASVAIVAEFTVGDAMAAVFVAGETGLTTSSDEAAADL